MARRLHRCLVVLVLLLTPATFAWAESAKLDLSAKLAVRHLRAVQLGEATLQSVDNQGPVDVLADQAMPLPITARGELDCFVVGNVTRGQLEAAGARVRFEYPGGIFTVFIPLDAVEAVAAIADVQKIEGAQIQSLHHDVSIPTTGATTFRGTGPAFSGINGAGVIVGNIDTGVDYDRLDFKDNLGNTRFLKIWDQTDAIGPPAAGFGYGSDWTAADINSTASRAKDTHGHGSHTLGTAGGNGAEIGPGSAPAYTYAGMAPMADLIAVDASTAGSFSNTGMLDGVSYIFQQATAFGKNAVANLSIGGQFGPHDGSSTFEVAMDALTGPGRAVVFSASNDRGSLLHGETFATGGGADITMTVTGGNVTGRRVQINGWYNSTEVINVTIITPNGTVVGPVTLGNVNAAFPGVPTANGAVYIENGVATSTNGSRQVILDFQCQNGLTQNMTGTWTFRFTAVSIGAALGEVDLWRNFQSTTALNANFAVGSDPTTEIINAIGTGLNTITTTSWTSKRFWTDCDGTTNINFNGAVDPGPFSPFAGMGPTRDNRNKPDISAPGSAIASVNSGDFVSSCAVGASVFLPGLKHVMNQGTSMAAPHTAGAIALLFQKYGALTVPQVRANLQARALTDGFTGAVWNKDYGYGKLNLGDMLDPTCTVTAPNGGEYVIIGNPINLTWNANDLLGGVTGVDLELSRDGGTIWETIALNEPNDGVYSWVSTGPPTAQAILRATAKDVGTNSAADVSNATWTILDPLGVDPDERPVTVFAVDGIKPSIVSQQAVIEYSVPRPSDVTLALFDLQGREVAVLASGPHPVGRHKVTWNGEVDHEPARAGVYFLRLTSPGGITASSRFVVAH